MIRAALIATLVVRPAAKRTRAIERPLRAIAAVGVGALWRGIAIPLARFALVESARRTALVPTTAVRSRPSIVASISTWRVIALVAVAKSLFVIARRGRSVELTLGWPFLGPLRSIERLSRRAGVV
jgi:hypothetical protein